MLQGRWRQGFAGVEGTSGQKSLVRITIWEPVLGGSKSTAERQNDLRKIILFMQCNATQK
jgi:hypothetical protein